MQKSNIKKRRPLITYLILFLILFICIFPYLWVVLNSFKADIEMFTENPFKFFKPTFLNYINVWVEKDFSNYFFNSIIVASGCTIFSLLVGVPAAYGLSRLKIFGGKALLAFMISTILVPPITLAIPLYLLFRDLKMLDSVIGLIAAISIFNIVFIIWLMKGFFDEIPISIEESAKIDGCSKYGSFWHIALKLVMPGIITITAFSFIFAWNDFLFALILSGKNSKTMTVAIPDLLQRSGTTWGGVCAEAVIQTIPIIIFTIIIFKNIVRGLTFGAIKG